MLFVRCEVVVCFDNRLMIRFLIQATPPTQNTILTSGHSTITHTITIPQGLKLASSL